MKERICLISLGCDKNLTDSQVMLGILERAGFDASAEAEAADLIIINTCCFIADALEESIETILASAELKETGKCRGIIVAGCIAERYRAGVFDEMPEVDAVVGTTGLSEIAEVCRKVLDGEKAEALPDPDTPISEELAEGRVLSAPNHYGYLKVSEGCDNHCTYCIIPKLRGRQRSRSIESLVREAERMAREGARELILVAQDTAAYGKDLYGEPSLARLLKALCRVEGIEWIRLLYCYPENITEELMSVMAGEEKVCKYIDMPIQHISDEVLKRMGRRTTAAAIREKIEALRRAVPGIAIRTTLITGFPGETEEDFAELAEFVKEIKFDRLGVFAYSREEGTPAYSLPDQVSDELKNRRREIIMEAQQGISAGKCGRELGRRIKVIIDGRIPEEGVYCGRSEKDAPDIDGMVFVSAERELASGEFLTVEITEAMEYDLLGVPAED